MSQKVDWAKHPSEAEKTITDKIASVGISNGNDENDPKQCPPAEGSLLAKIIQKGLVNSKNDPKSPLYSVKSFDDLDLKPNLLKGVYEMGFETPSKIQEIALPTLLRNPPQNLIAQSLYRTGKTVAFIIAMLNRVDPSKNHPQVLCLSPTSELTIQTGEVTAHMAKYCPEIEMKFVVRGEEVPRGTKLKEHILIGTPGKVLDWGVKYKFFDLKKISVFVLDEADVMIATQGHQDKCIKIHKHLSTECQMMFFSATYDQEILDFAEHIVKNPVIVQLGLEEKSFDNISQYYVRCANVQEKYNVVTNIYGTVDAGQAIIFCHTRKTAAWLAAKMSRDGHAVAVLTGDLAVEQRISVLDKFREGKDKVLITTNVLSRCLYVGEVDLVVNFDLPVDMIGKPDYDTYLFRICYTCGRFSKSGIAINLVDSDQAMAICKSIEEHFGKTIQYLNPDPKQYIPAECSLLAKISRKGLVNTKSEIQIQQQDPNCPLNSVKLFDDLSLKPNLLKGVYELGFKTPSKIQEIALPILLTNPPQNLIAQSQYKTGKTAAFVLAMLSRVDPSKNYPQVLCLSPTYELTIQTGEVIAHMAKYCPEIEMKFVVIGEEDPRGTKLNEHILIGTPGKVLDWGVTYKFFDLKKISVFVLDEADVMIGTQGHQDQCLKIYKHLSIECQMMFFSATYDQKNLDFAEHIVKNPIIIKLGLEEETFDNISQYYVRCANVNGKYNAVINIFETVGDGQAIIFCHTRKTAAWLVEKMSRDGHAVAVLPGDLAVEQRISQLDKFREGEEKILITTNVFLKGIDVGQVDLVVNFDLPVDMNGKADCGTYLFRICCGGRFGKSLIAINLVDSDHAMAICESIEQHFGKKIQYLNTECERELFQIIKMRS